MAALDKFKQIQRSYSGKVDVSVVYIEETHPDDRKHFKDYQWAVSTHRDMEDRIKAAQMLQAEMADFSGHMLVDQMNNEANYAYGGFAERLIIISEGIIAYEGGIGPFNYNVDEMAEALDDIMKKVN